MVSVVTWICTSQCQGGRVDTGPGTAAIRPGELVHVRGNTMPGRRDDLGTEQIFINNNERRRQNNMVKFLDTSSLDGSFTYKDRRLHPPHRFRRGVQLLPCHLAYQQDHPFRNQTFQHQNVIWIYEFQLT